MTEHFQVSQAILLVLCLGLSHLILIKTCKELYANVSIFTEEEIKAQNICAICVYFFLNESYEELGLGFGKRLGLGKKG